MNTVELLKQITDYLTLKCSRVYHEKVTQKSIYPYIVFNLPSSTDISPGDDAILEVDIWDNINDETRLENLTDSIDGDGDKLNPSGLNRKTFNANGVIATFYREGRYQIDDENETIRRRQLRYIARIYYE